MSVAPSHPTERHHGLMPLVAHAALLGAMVLPFFFGAAAGLVDMPNAIGRMAVNSRLWADPQSSEFYQFQLKLLPNMALDIWGLFLTPIIGAERAANLFLALAVIVVYVGVQALRVAACGRSSVLIGALSVFAIYSFALRFGFANYVFASGVMLFAVARFEANTRTPSPRFAISQAILLGFIFTCSLYPVLLYAVWLAFRMPVTPAERAGVPLKATLERWFWNHFATFIMVSVLFVFSRTAPPWGSSTSWKLDSKLEGLESLLFYRREPFDLSLGTMVIVLAAVLVLCWCVAVPRLYWRPLIALLLTFLVMPEVFKGVAFSDSRLTLCIAGLVLGCAKIEYSMARKRVVDFCAIGLCIVAILKPAAMWLQIKPLLQLEEAIDVAFRQVPEGSTIMIVQAERDQRVSGLEAWHLPLVQLVKGDYFFPLLFENYFVSFKGHITNDLRRLSDLPNVPPRFNCRGGSHLVLLGFGPSQYGEIPEQPITRIGAVAIYRLREESLNQGKTNCPLW